MGVLADGFRTRITTFTPQTLRGEQWEYEERLLWPCGRPKRESDKERQDSHEKACAEIGRGTSEK
jgi:hypothetical protein